MERQELLELLAKHLSKNDYDKAEELLDKIIDEAVTHILYDYGYI